MSIANGPPVLAPKERLWSRKDFVFGVALALIVWGAQLIGITVNIWLGALVLLIAFCLIARAFWAWEGSSKWHVAWRTVTVFVAAAVYVTAVSVQIKREWIKEHPQHPMTTIAQREQEPPNPIQEPKKQLDSQPNQKSTKLTKKIKPTATTQSSQGSNSPNVAGDNNVVGTGNVVGNTFVNLGPENATGEQRKTIRVTLGQFMAQGMALRNRCRTDPPESALDSEGQKWFEDVSKWLLSHLDSSFYTQFVNEKATPLNPGGVPEARKSLWLGLNQRVETLDRFIDQFK